jgi:hypothetical protein
VNPSGSAIVRRLVLATALAAALAAGGLTGAGCAGGPPAVRTTFLQSVDLIEMTDRMAASLAGAPAITGRDAASERWVVSMERISNRTNQLIPDGEKWLYVARLRARLAAADLSREANLVWVMPPERWTEVATELDDPREPRELRTPPTHQLTGTFLALTTTSGAGRSDTTVCSYQLVDLATGELVWEGSWEVKRAVSGRTYD